MNYNKLIVSTILVLIFSKSYSQYTAIDSSLYFKTIQLDEVVISATLFPEFRTNVAQKVLGINASEIKNTNPQTVPDMLSNSGSVLVQNSQAGGGSPIIRGFEASRVLLVVDGVRMNNLIFRAGHLQNSMTMDVNALKNAEILFGPSSTSYGSDALGGVIHFHTINPVFSENNGELNVTGNLMLRYSSANNENTSHVDFNLGGHRLASITSFTISNFGDVRQGNNRNPFYGDTWKRIFYVDQIDDHDTLLVNDDPNIQKFTAYKQMDLLEKISFQQSTHLNHTINFQISNTGDLPRYDRLTDQAGSGLKYAQWYYGPQKRMLAAYELSANDLGGFFSTINGGFNYQQVQESRNTRKFNSNTLTHRIEDVTVTGLNVSARHLGDKVDFKLGIEGYLNSLKSTANSEDIINGIIDSLDTRYPDGDNTMNSFALFTSQSWFINNHFVMNTGLRFENISLHSTFVNQTFFPFPFNSIDQTNNALCGNLGLIFNSNNNWRIALSGSTGFRAPDVDDLSKVFESAPGVVIVPNPDLKPEKTYNGDLSIGKIMGDNFQITVDGFYTIFSDAIVTDKFNFNGADSVMYDGTLSEVFANQNKQSAYLYGTSGSINTDINNHFSITSSVTYTYGRINGDSVDTPLDHIPPVYGKINFIYHKNKFRGDFGTMFNGWKRLDDYFLNGEDNEQYATPYGMPAWFTLNAHGSYEFKKYLMVQFGIENILDTNYRIFASGISSPGRNLYVSLRSSF